MRTYTTEHTVYAYDELSDTAKEVARQWWVDGLQYDNLSDALSEYLQDILLPKYKLKCDDAKLRYSFSYSQGDGASFTGRIEYNGTWYGDVITNSYGSHYTHYNTVNVHELYSLKTDREAPQPTVDRVDEMIHEIGRALERYGYEYIEYEGSQEVVEANISANEYEFYETGKVA